MDDFEHGLVLLGLLSPSSDAEVNEILELEKFEKETSKQRQQTHFKRVVLAAEILYQLHNEPTFGRIKFQKLVYLCEHVAQMNLEHRYAKQAAGPFDNKFMHSINKEVKKLKWFDVQNVTEHNISRSKYIPLENAGKHKSFFETYFHNENDRIQFIIDLFRSKKTDETELAATVFACYLELHQKGQLDRDQLFKTFYGWSEKKGRFTEVQVIKSFQWLVSNGLIPDITI